MTKKRDEHLGVAQTLVDRLNTQRLPWLLDIEKRVQAGARLNDAEIELLEQILRESQENAHIRRELVKEFPDLQGLISRVVDLYSSITSKALENEQKASS